MEQQHQHQHQHQHSSYFQATISADSHNMSIGNQLLYQQQQPQLDNTNQQQLVTGDPSMMSYLPVSGSSESVLNYANQMDPSIMSYQQEEEEEEEEQVETDYSWINDGCNNELNRDKSSSNPYAIAPIIATTTIAPPVVYGDNTQQQTPSSSSIMSRQQQQQHVFYSDSPAHKSNHASPSAMQSSPSISAEWLDNICKQLIEHMNTFGICVIDNFLGTIYGDSILKEVCNLYNNGLFRRGQLVNNRLVNGRVHLVRGDSIIWVDGTENECKQIEMLIQTLDSVIINCNKMSGNNGEFDRHVINQRTKAMIACYPGNGTHYIKHIDNPNGDGRCITSIYYLNKDWDIEHDGGLLRIFPVGIDEVANIAPLFDRVLFFWSDRRNPHEVQPSHRVRFAITIWFIDSNEKQRQQQKQQKLQLQQQQRQTDQLYNFNRSN